MNALPVLSSKQKKLYTAMLLLSLTAVAVTIYLIWIHVKPAEIGSFCDINDYFNCDRINQSTFAELFGIPMAFLGFGFYVFLSLLIVGILRGYRFWRDWLFTSKWSLGLLAIGCSIASIYLSTVELPFPGTFGYLPVWTVGRNLVFVAAALGLFLKYRNNHDQRVRFTAWLAILTLFGVNFSLYLTDIELFVLQGICLFCLSQQIIIVIIAGLNLYELKQIAHEQRSKINQS